MLDQAQSIPIDVAGVSKTYPGGVQALRSASFRIAAGARACLLGPNGAGKTTIIRLLTGALQPTAGTARLWGVSADDPAFLAAKRRVGIVPQASGMYRDYTVGEYLELVRDLYDRGAVAAVLEAFGLGPFRDRRMAQLSGGYQRRLALAAALLPQPDLLLLDEPTVGLDPVAARDVHEYLRTIMPNRTTLLCTHNLAEAEALCDTVVILRSGQVLLHDSLARLRRRAQPQLELAAVEGPERLQQALAERGYHAEIVNGQVNLPFAAPQQHAPALLRDLLAADINVYECHVLTPSLEDLFLQIVETNDDPA